MTLIIFIISLISLLFISDAPARDTADSGAIDPSVEVAEVSVAGMLEQDWISTSLTPTPTP